MPDVVQEALSLINSTSESNRQESQSLRLSMYLDDYTAEITALLEKQFHKDNVVRLYPMLARYYNTLKKIVNLKSVIYKQSAERKWYKADGKTIDKKYEELVDKSNIDTTMILTNKLTNVNNTSFVRIIPDIENKSIKYASVPSELVSVVQDPSDPSKIISLLHRVTNYDTYNKLNRLGGRESGGSYSSIYFYWDANRYLIFNNGLKEITQDDNPDGLNPYGGIIPYTLFSNLGSIAGSIWNETVNSDLYDGTLQVNVLQTYLNNATKLAAYRQMFISGLDEKDAERMNRQVSDGLQPITSTNENAKAITLDLSGGLSGVNDIIHDVISEISDNHGVSFNSRTSSASVASGLSLAISNEQINNIREEQHPLYRESEKELALKTAIVANKDLKYNIDISGSLSINFYEDKPLVPAKDKVVVDSFDLKNNLKSVVDLYREIDPDVKDDTEAEQRIEANKEINDRLLPTFSLGMGDDEEEEAEDATT